jgi:hypothetical protein
VKGGGQLATLKFDFITTWVSDMVTLLQTNAITVITAVLVLIALVMGAFWLIGLGKKGVKKAK